MIYFVVSFKADSLSPHAMYPQHGFEHAYIGPNSPGHAKFRPGCTNFEALQRAGLCCFSMNIHELAWIKVHPTKICFPRLSFPQALKFARDNLASKMV